MLKLNSIAINTVTDGWDDIFSDTILTVLPLAYIEHIALTFKNGKSWIIPIPPRRSKQLVEFESGVDELIYSYRKEIRDVDVKINTRKVKKVVEKAVKKMLSKINN